MSLRARLLGLVLLATLLPALLLGWRFIRDSEAEIQTAVASLATSANTVAADLEHRVQGTAQLHYGLAHSQVLDTSDRPACSTYLSEVREAYPQYTGILTVLPDGNLFCDSLRTGRVLNLRDRGYFKRVVGGGTELVLEPVFGRLTGNSVLQIVYPVRNPTGSLRFMLVASLNLQKFAKETALDARDPPLELLLVDQEGVVMASTSSNSALPAAGTSIANSALFALAKSSAAGGEVKAADGQVQVWAVATRASAKDAGLYVMVGTSKQDLVAPTKARLQQDLLLLASEALLLFCAVWMLAEWGIRRQVDRIAEMVRHLSAGDLSARIALPHPRGELGGLMGLLNHTAESLQQQRASIEELGQRLRQAQKMEAVGTLAGGIAHDFNNVLGAILGNLAMAQDEAATGRTTQQSLSQIRLAALRARDLVKRIQTFSRQDTPALVNQALLPIVEEVLGLVRVALPAGVALHTELQAKPLWVAVDATQLHQVLMNLCSNAWQALQSGHGTITVGLREVDSAREAQQAPLGAPAQRQAHLWVSDTGCGIPAPDQQRIFEPFFTTKSGRGGTGLGLSVVHGIVNAHHGSLVVESRVGQGSTFHVYLPLVAEAPQEATQPTATLGVMPQPQGHGEHVLYLDDDDVMAVMVERLLSRSGYRVSCFASAVAALAAVKAEPQLFDLVVTDFNMPELSGLEVSQALAQLRADLPVIIMSGYIVDALPEQAQQLGVRAIVRKENVLEELTPAIARALVK